MHAPDAHPVGEKPWPWVVGWGRTRHIPHPVLGDPNQPYRQPQGLCGAFGGNRLADPEKRPTCKRCERMAASSRPAGGADRG